MKFEGVGLKVLFFIHLQEFVWDCLSSIHPLRVRDI
jgi:hypothetical protein